jgi:hypothetical protein
MGPDVEQAENLTGRLINRILNICRESGATLEESLAAVRAAEAILPVCGIRRKTDLVVRT